MLDIKFVKNNKEKVRERLLKNFKKTSQSLQTVLLTVIENIVMLKEKLTKLEQYIKTVLNN